MYFIYRSSKDFKDEPSLHELTQTVSVLLLYINFNNILLLLAREIGDINVSFLP